MSGVQYFNIHLKGIMQEKGLKVGQLASLINVHTSTASLWVNGLEMPPDDIQCLIALWLNANRDEVWEFKKELFNEIIEMSKLHKKLAELEKDLNNKLNNNHEEH